MDTNKLKLRIVELLLVIAIVVVIASIPLKIIFREELKQIDTIVANFMGTDASLIQGTSAIVGLVFLFWFAYHASKKDSRRTGRFFSLVVMTLMSIAGICFAGFGTFIIIKITGSTDVSTGKIMAGIGSVLLFFLFSFICFKLFLRAKNSANKRFNGTP